MNEASDKKGGVSIKDSQTGVVGDKADIDGGIYLINADKGATVIVNPKDSEVTAVKHDTALKHYLDHVISQNRYLQLQGIRSGGRMVHIELDRIYITLRTIRKREVTAEEEWLKRQCDLAPGEDCRLSKKEGIVRESVSISVNEALAGHSRLVVLGDPGSGKTTLLRYLALMYARDLAKGTSLVAEKLGLEESGRLPVLFPLRKIGAFLRAAGADDGTEGHVLLLRFLLRSMKNERIELSDNFFDEYLKTGKAAVFLDGLDEVADPELRRRVSRLVEAFTRAYPGCRYVVTSRIVGYTGSARLGEAYKTTTIRDFTISDVAEFLKNWHRLIVIGEMGPGPKAAAYAKRQTRHLLEAIESNERVRELAINPLMLTVITLVHRDRVKLPDRRAELYAEAVEVLLGKWDEARGVKETAILEDRPFDTGDKRLTLQTLALTMHENQQKEISAENLRALLLDIFVSVLGDRREAERAAGRFLNVIEQRTGLLAARGEGVYSFSHLTFQEYLAALAVAARDDYAKYTLGRVPDRWWRETILLEAGYLSTQSKERTTRLIRAIADLKKEPEPYHNLVLAAECLRDVGRNRIVDNIENEVWQRLRKGIETPPSFLSRMLRKYASKGWIEQRDKAMNALVRAGAGYCSPPYGEPEWMEIPAGRFLMGSNREKDSQANDYEMPQHEVTLSAYAIAKIPVTNAQYHLFVKKTGHEPPKHWADNRPPKEKESHPVVSVSWDDAMAYCEWLSKVTRRPITLPTEAQWEKAARGDDQRIYPWGNTFDLTRCNSNVLGLGDTTPAGIFPEGASPYGVLDMAGNVWEWCRDGYGGYPSDKVIDPAGPDNGSPRVMRGGSWDCSAQRCRAASRIWDPPVIRSYYLGFRLVLLPG